MSGSEQHPSFLELDRLALDAPTSPATREHVAGCAVCQEHLASLSPPRDLSELPAIRRRVRARPAARLLWAAPALAAAAAVALFVLSRPPGRVDTEIRGPAAEDGFTTVKGSAAVLLHVKRGERVFVWDGAEPVVPGDKLRLEVAADGFTHVTVLAEPRGERGAEPAVLYSASIDPGRPVALPKAWEVDDAPGEESLVVLLSSAPLDEGAARDAARAPRDGIWIRRLVLPKRSAEEKEETP